MKIHVLTKTCECSHQLYSQQVQNTYNPKMFITIMMCGIFTQKNIIFSCKKERSTNTSYNMGKP